MVWQTIGTLSLDKEWRTLNTPTLGGRLFRTRQNWSNTWPGTGHVQLSAFYSDGGRYGFQKLGCSKDYRLVILPVPEDLEAAGFNVRYLTARINSYARLFSEHSWQLTIEEWVDV